MKTTIHSKVTVALLTIFAVLQGMAYGSDAASGIDLSERMNHTAAWHPYSSKTSSVSSDQMLRFNEVDGQPIR